MKYNHMVLLHFIHEGFRFFSDVKTKRRHSETLTFRIFADDTNLFASARDLNNLETLINSELGKVKVWCDVNKLSINFIKTNYMIIKSNRKASGSIEVKLQNIDGSS